MRVEFDIAAAQTDGELTPQAKLSALELLDSYLNDIEDQAQVSVGSIRADGEYWEPGYPLDGVYATDPDDDRKEDGNGES